MLEANVEKCLLGILQRGITEARSLCLTNNEQDAAALLDALDNIPRHLNSWQENSDSVILNQLNTYQNSTHASMTNYAQVYQSRENLL